MVRSTQNRHWRAPTGPHSNRLAENGPPIPWQPGRTIVGLLNANPYPMGIANLGAQVIAAELMETFNVEFGFADTTTPTTPFLSGGSTPAECAVLAVSVPFEDTYHHVPRMLRHCGLAEYAQDRQQDSPIVVAGGMALINPMPLSPFFDAMVIGEGRRVMPRIVQATAQARAAGARREDILRELAALPGVYVPSLYNIDFDPNGSVENFAPTDGSPPEVTAGRAMSMVESPITSLWTSPRSCYSMDDYFSIMMSLGCKLKCPFCVVGFIQGEQSGQAINSDADLVVELAEARRAAYGTELIKLFFASSFTSGEPGIDPLGVKNILAKLLDRRFEVRTGSLNIRQADDELMDMVVAAGQDRVTFAPETGQSLRPSIGKRYSKDDKIVDMARAAGRRGLGLDLYTMLGLPEERPGHVAELADLINECRSALAGAASLEVSLNPCFAKAQTPFERYATVRPEVVRHRFAWLRDQLDTEDGIDWVSVIDDPMCYYQPILALGGPELAPVLIELSDTWKPTEDQWREAVWRHVGDDRRYFRDRAADERLPWEHIIANEHGALNRRRAARLTTARKSLPLIAA